MADAEGSCSGSGPPKKRAYKFIIESGSSDDEQGSNAEVISIKSSSSESSLGLYVDSLDDNTDASSEAETLDGASSPDFLQSLSQLTASSVLGTQQEYGSVRPLPLPPQPPSSHQSEKKKRKLSTAPLDSLAATAAAQQPASTTTSQAPKLTLTKATTAKETTKPTKRAAAKATKPLDDMTLEELSIAYSSTEQPTVPAKKKSPAKKQTPTKTKKTPAKKNTPAKKLKSPTKDLQPKKHEPIDKATGSHATDATTSDSFRIPPPTAHTNNGPAPMSIEPESKISKSKNSEVASVTTNPMPPLTKAVPQVKSGQQAPTKTIAPKKDVPAAAKKGGSSSKTKPTNNGDGLKEKKPKPVSKKEQASKEVAKKETLTEAAAPVKSGQQAPTKTIAPKKDVPAAAKKGGSSSKTKPTNNGDGLKEKKPKPVSKKEQASKEVAKKETLTEAAVPVKPGQQAPKTDTTAAAKKGGPSSKTKPTNDGDGMKENKPQPVSTKEQASKEVAKKETPKKKKKMTFQDQVLNHMLFSFKPFTLKTLAEALKTTDTVLNFVMLSLTDKDLVIKKDFTSAKGKPKTLYWANHDSKAKEVAAAMASSEEIEATEVELEGLRRQQAALSSALTGLSGQLSNEELTSQLVQEEAELETLRHQLKGAKARIQAAKAPPKQPKSIMDRGPVKSAALLARERCPRRTKMRINAMRGEWRKRKEQCTDFIDMLADGMEKKPKEVIKLLEIETDEIIGVEMPPKHVIE
jgi:DNA-binding transcriptional regulator GbsR (MarR family)